MHVEERPREKAIKYGVENLSNRELLAILLRCGYKGKSVLLLADELIAKVEGIQHLRTMDLQELTRIKGISEIKAIELMACFELVKRSTYHELVQRKEVSEPKVVANYLMQKIGNEKQEHFIVLFLNTKHAIINEKVLFIGSLNHSVVHAREIFKAAIVHNSAKILVAHNHPSGDCIPSEQDVQVTKRLQETGEMVGIPLLDHIIVSSSTYFSFKEKGFF